MGGSDDGAREDELVHTAMAVVHGWSHPDPTFAKRLHNAAHDGGVEWARLLLRIEPFARPGEHVHPWTELAAARRRCRRAVGHCPHPLTGMGLEWCCCCCGALLDPPPAGPCRVCSVADAPGRGL